MQLNLDALNFLGFFPLHMFSSLIHFLELIRLIKFFFHEINLITHLFIFIPKK